MNEEAEKWWKDNTELPSDKTPNVNEMNAALKKIAIIIELLVHDIEDPTQYWESMQTIINSISKARCPDPLTNFPEFISFLYTIRNHLKPTTPEEVISFITSSPVTADSMFLIWKFSDVLGSPLLFIDSLNTLMKMRIPFKQQLSTYSGSLDFIFDHYFPMLDSFSTTNNNTITTHINLLQFLCRLLIDFPTSIHKFSKYHISMWNKLLKYMTNPNLTLKISSFRIATDFFQKTMHQLTPQNQADLLLKLIVRNPPSSPLHIPSIRFAMVIRPSEFGFITLCKTIIDQGIIDQCDISIIGRVLRLPCIKNPTEIFQYLFKTGTSNKLLASSCAKVLQKPLLNFKNLNEFRPWAILYTKRSFQFIAFAEMRNKYKYRSVLIVRFFYVINNLEIDWLSTTIKSCASTLLKMEKCLNLLQDKFKQIKDFDQRFADEINNTPVDKVDLKHLLDDVKTNLKLLKTENEIEEEMEQKKKKPTIAEMKAKFRRSQLSKNNEIENNNENVCE